ncbi:MAG: hypothetical protein GDA46_06125 [Bdellovibrionales bacterium]|nr:hypothetical protein [Bdellovibrionales bacterium]
MSLNKDNKKKDDKKKENQEPNYWERVFHGKGTVAEDWPTAKELWNDPKVKKIIDDHNESVKKHSHNLKEKNHK